jgi:pyruvate formate lyase activating enzyme
MGYKNLAVFFEACTFNCLFCQNWHFRSRSSEVGTLGPESIMDSCDEKTSCICYFGGDPTPQLVYAIRASKLARERRKGILRVCWETNGSMNPKLLMRTAELSLVSGGCVKFDLKAWHDEIHYALCGVSNRRTLSNFKLLAEYKNDNQRPNPPLLIASTLLVPGYIDEEEVGNIARFIASLDRDIPYSLLGFHPHFYMEDLPRTSRRHAERCLKAATDAGLRRVRIGNIHLLGDAY